jgi:hypothetical protein
MVRPSDATFSPGAKMNRITFLAAALLVAAGCGDAGPNPVSADGSGPALSGTSLPNLYVSQIVPYRDSNGALRARVRVCNNGTASAGASTTYLQHWSGLSFESFDIYTTNLPAGWCTSPFSPPLLESPGVTHSYYASADDYQVIQESDENDNTGELIVYP